MISPCEWSSIRLWPFQDSRKYRVTNLVYVERYAEVHEAIAREKQLKGWNRAWKLKLIEQGNPTWNDLDPTAC